VYPRYSPSASTTVSALRIPLRIVFLLSALVRWQLGEGIRWEMQVRFCFLSLLDLN
jgi:hypothetical protein